MADASPKCPWGQDDEVLSTGSETLIVRPSGTAFSVGPADDGVIRTHFVAGNVEAAGFVSSRVAWLRRKYGDICLWDARCHRVAALAAHGGCRGVLALVDGVRELVVFSETTVACATRGELFEVPCDARHVVDVVPRWGMSSLMAVVTRGEGGARDAVFVVDASRPASSRVCGIVQCATRGDAWDRVIWSPKRESELLVCSRNGDVFWFQV